MSKANIGVFFKDQVFLVSSIYTPHKQAKGFGYVNQEPGNCA